MQIKLIFTTKVSHLASFWKWDFLELGNGLSRRDRGPQRKKLRYGNELSQRQHPEISIAQEKLKLELKRFKITTWGS